MTLDQQQHGWESAVDNPTTMYVDDASAVVASSKLLTLMEDA